MQKKDSILTLQRIPHFTNHLFYLKGQEVKLPVFGTTFISRKIGNAKADYY